MSEPITKIGVFGGTFDPPHVAHVVLAAAAVHQLGLDELIITPAGVPWQKVGSREITDPDVRLEMTRRAFEVVDRAVVSDIEMRRTGNTYTVDTLQAIADDAADSGPTPALYLLLGSDTAAGLDTWERPHDVADLATIAVFPRRGHDDAEPPPQFAWLPLELPGLEISSTDIRARRADGRPISGLVPPAVAEIIERNGLYLQDGP